MLEFVCLGSGSGGNAYIFKEGEDIILVECGIEQKKLTSKLMDHGILPSQIKAVVVTHGHGDHICSIDYWLARGTKILAPRTCLDQFADSVILAENGTKCSLTDNIQTLAFSVNHDCDALGYIFFFKNSKESVLFINDTYYFDFPYTSFGFDYVFIECNHIRKMVEEIKEKCIASGLPTAKYDRQLEYHMSLAALKKFLKNMNLSKTKKIYLMHLSKECCDGELCKTIIGSTFKCDTFVCGEHGGFY